jgi:6-phosphofructokinase 1
LGRRKNVDEIRSQAKISVIRIPKTIDNDINLLRVPSGQHRREHGYGGYWRSHVEHWSANGVGLVKLMGRHSGFWLPAQDGKRELS